MQVSRRSIRTFAQAGFPGLIFFGKDEPLVVPINRRVTDLKLFIPEKQMLSLTGVRIEGANGESIVSGKCSASSVHENVKGGPENLLLKRPFHSKLEFFPHWSIEFEEPTFVRRVEVFNRPDWQSARALGVCADWTRADGFAEHFDNLSVYAVEQKAAKFFELLDALEYRLSEATSLHTNLRRATEKLRSHCQELVQTIRGTSEATSIVHVAERRCWLLREIFDAIEQDLKSAFNLMPVLTPILTALLWRGSDASAFSDSTERSVLALIWANALAANKAIGFDEVQKFQRVLDTRPNLAFAEAELNRLLAKAKPETGSYVINHHGIRRAKLIDEKEAYLDSLLDVISLLEANGWAACVCYGTLLGAIREKGFIPHDDDVDLLMINASSDVDSLRKELAILLDKLGQQGISARFEEIPHGPSFLKILSPKGGKYVDAFPMLNSSSTAVSIYMHQLRLGDVPRDVILPLRQIDFYGRSIPAPAQPEKLLELRYGSGWTTPDQYAGVGWLRNDSVSVSPPRADGIRQL